ncbi:defective chorion-1 protein, FC106 isoform isoform X1 [Rhagoletis pomonella]|uniref:defective chorion-1 protein, FC106 isoform isoform X1 n=1 Tax=Rhagoletis pomonella TaxID=28610 RepID=UPI0017805295|nr:defective chorion-1 protein, FC106 isoform isoform X1 [Rhagoletis pomonella]
MIWFKTCALLQFLLALSVTSLVSSQGIEGPSLANDPSQNIDEDTIDLTPSIDLSSEKTEDDRGAGQIVGQSLFTPLLGQGILPGPLNMFGLMFPALNSLLLLGNLFPAPSLLGQPSLLGSSQQIGASQNDELPSASKVVLVLAEDRNPHAAMRAANQEAARTIRQNDMLSQLLDQIRQADFGQMLFEQMQQQNPGQMLQQIVPQDISQSVGQLLSQTLQQIPIAYSPLSGLGQASGEPAVLAAIGQTEGESVAPAADMPPSSTSVFQFPIFQSAIDAGSQILGQAFQPLNADSSSGFPVPNIQSAIDAGSQMLGQALQQANADATTSGFQFPNIQSVIDSGSQMLSQSGGLFNLRPMQSLDPPMSSSDAEPAASQVSEVRVKPEAIPAVHNPSEQNMRAAENMDDLKMMAGLKKALVHKKLPILWFRIPIDSRETDPDIEVKHQTEPKQKNCDELKLETRLQAFQRQVISELKLLQNIERQAKEMRSASSGATDKVFKENHHTSILSKLPVHKITRADIEKALNDEYVKRLLQKVAIANRKGTGKSRYQEAFTPTGANFKRQTMTPTPTMTPRPMSREEIVRLMAYAYRMANANGIPMLESPDIKKPTTETDAESSRAFGVNEKTTEHQWATDPKTPSHMTTMKPIDMQWADDRMQMPQTQNLKQNPTMIHTARQLQDKMNQAMDRQWIDEQKMEQLISPQKLNIEDPKQQQTMEQMSQRMPVERQWDQTTGTRSWMQENPQMPIQRQWIDTQTQGLTSPITRQQQITAATPEEERIWAGKFAMQQPSMVVQQQPMTIQQPQVSMQQPPMAMQEQPMATQQPAIDIQQQRMTMQQPPVSIQQTPMDVEQHQMVTQPPTMDIQQERTPMQQRPMTIQQPHITMQQPQVAMQQQPMTMQQPQLKTQQPQVDMMILQQMPPEMQRQMQNPDTLASPQMPDNEGKARLKGASILDEFDLLGIDWKRGVKGKVKTHGILRPTVINYYYNAGGRAPGYGYSGSSYQPSYSGGAGAIYGPASGYGGGASSYSSGSAAGSYGSSGYVAPTGGSYRMAIGDDEIQAMLKEHSQMKMMPETYPNPVITDNVPTLIFQSTKSATDNNMSKPISTQMATFSKEDEQNSTLTASYPTTHSSKMSRLDCKLRLNSVSDKDKTSGGDYVRHKRNANFGSLQPIDANSLKELRKTYKDSLKEITLKPDEDPAEALMRYNEASIRHALEQANQEPMEISTDEHAAPSVETQNNDAYFKDAQVQVLNHDLATGHVVSQSHLYVPAHNGQHKHYKVIGEPSSPNLNIREQAIKILTLKDHTKSLDKTEILAAIKNSHETSVSSKKSIDAPQNIIFTLPESELKTVLELISHQMQMCCDKCRDRIISSIKANIKEEHSEEGVQKSNHDYAAKHSRAANSFEDESKSDDEKFNKWLREMEAKGYDSKYLTKSHHWQYLNSGKLTLALESNEGKQQVDNKISKKANDQQSLKRYTHVNSLLDDDDKKNTQNNMSSKIKGKAFEKKVPELNYLTKEHAHVVNDELRHLKDSSEEGISSPYAMRGKFKSIKVSSRTGTSPGTTPVKFCAMSQEPHTGSTVDANKAKVVELLSLLYDLSPKTESVNTKPTQFSVMVMPIVATSTEGPEHLTTTSRARTKRGRSRRRQKTETGIVTQPDKNMLETVKPIKVNS